MESRKFDPARLDRLNDPARLEALPPAALWEAADVDEEAVVVDVGAGTGIYDVAIARLAPRARFYAADISEQMLGFLREHLPEDVGPRITPLLVTESALPLTDAAADLVMMVAVFHEFDDPRASLEEARRVLRPGGRLLIADWRKGGANDMGPSDEKRVATEAIVAHVGAVGFVQVETHESLSHFVLVTGTRH